VAAAGCRPAPTKMSAERVRARMNGARFRIPGSTAGAIVDEPRTGRPYRTIFPHSPPPFRSHLGLSRLLHTFFNRGPAPRLYGDFRPSTVDGSQFRIHSDSEGRSEIRAIPPVPLAVHLLETMNQELVSINHGTDRTPAVHSKSARRLAPLVAVAVLGIATAACGSGTGASSSGQPNTTTPSTTAGHSGGSSTSGSGGAAF
jgi:hypothetical protein